jgi:hypothetical protein
MPLTVLSVPELARMTGLAIDSTWKCATVVTARARIAIWCSPEWPADTMLMAAPSSLPIASAVRVEFRRGDAVWDTEWPLSFDVHWLREITVGFPLGARPVRARTASTLQTGVCLQGDFATLVWRSVTGETRVQVALNLRDAAPTVGLEAVVAPPTGLPKVMDEVMRALTGSTSVEWLRSVFAESCSSRWNELAQRIGARPDQLDDLAMFFRALTTTEEDSLWRAAATTGALFELQPWLELLASEQTSALEERLHEELQREGRSFWRGATGEWLNATAGGTMACLTSPGIAASLAETARKILSLLIRDDLARLLVRLRDAADEEWATLAPWYRSRIEDSCGTLSADLSAGRVMDEVGLWMKKLHQRLHLKCIEAARLRAQAALSASIISPAPEGGESKTLADLAIASSAEGDDVVEQILSGDLRPCFDRSLVPPHGVWLPSGRLGHLNGRRIAIEVLMPFLPKKSWTTAREHLAATLIQQTGDGQLTISGTGATEDSSTALESAALLLSAVFTSRTEAPSDDMIHMVHETRHTLQGNEADVAWLRLIHAYGLSVPALRAGPREATLRVEVPWNWAEAWFHVPLKRDAGYLDKFMHLSLTMQEMARHWLPALCLSTPEQFEAPNAVLPLLVYAASQPYADRRKAEFGYDAMSPIRVERAASSAVGRLPELLDPFYQSLKASGRSRTAEFYSPDRARLIVSSVQRKPRPLAALLAGDMFFLEHCFQLISISRELRAVAGRNPAQALRKLAQASEEIVKTCLRGMKRHYPTEACHGLAAVYLLEATRVLAAGSAGAGFRASLTMEAATGGQRLEAAA